MSSLPFLDGLSFGFGFLFSVFDGDILAGVGLEDWADVRRVENTDRLGNFSIRMDEEKNKTYTRGKGSYPPSPYPQGSHSKAGARYRSRVVKPHAQG